MVSRLEAKGFLLAGSKMVGFLAKTQRRNGIGSQGNALRVNWMGRDDFSLSDYKSVRAGGA